MLSTTEFAQKKLLVFRVSVNATWYDEMSARERRVIALAVFAIFCVLATELFLLTKPS